MGHYELSDREWKAIKPHLLNKPRGVPRVDDRRVLNGIFWVLWSGAPWADLPERYGLRTRSTIAQPVAKGGRLGPADGRHCRGSRPRRAEDPLPWAEIGDLVMRECTSG
jgi:transposase